MKRAGVIAAVVLVLALAAIIFSFYRSIPPLAGTERLPGLGANVEITFDSLAIPHITAASDADAMAALGYLHARERLWAMEITRRAAEGRLSEVLGSATVGTDRYLRSLDIARASDASLAMMSPESRALLDAYVRGVNAWISDRTRPLPPEFRVLRFAPEPWTTRQTFEIGRIMSWDLQSGATELRLARALARVGPERIRDLFPPDEDSGVTILGARVGGWTGVRVDEFTGFRVDGLTSGGVAPHTSKPVKPPTRKPVNPQTRQPAGLPTASLLASEIPTVPALADSILGWVAMSRASNSWVIGGARTASGKPILANDPHLELRAPALWYIASITSPGFHVAGATLPGVPGVVLGRNRRIAWGWTNAGVDDVDYVIERFSADTSRVLTVSGWQAAEVVRDSILVRGQPAVLFVMRRTSHGPIIGVSPAAADSTGEVRLLALRWNAHDPSDNLGAVLALDRAETWDAFVQAAWQLRTPEQNWIYADVDGNIGYVLAGSVPVRRAGNGLLPTPGWTDEGRWDRYLAFDEMPRALNPADGFIVTANNRIAGTGYPHFIAAEFAPPFRAARIREMILAGSAFTPDDVRRMQMDTLDVFARWAKDLAAAAADSAGRADVAAALRTWDGTMAAARTEPVVFYSWYRALQRLTFADELGGSYAPDDVMRAGLRAGASRWFDDIATPQAEGLETMSARAMREALAVAGTSTWGQVHRTTSRHSLGTAKPLDLLFRLNLGPDPRAGSLFTVNVADFGAFTPPFTNTHAASFRQVADLARPNDGMLILTTGQSGNPLSRHYRDQRRAWLEGRLVKVPLAREHGSSVLTLVP